MGYQHLCVNRAGAPGSRSFGGMPTYGWKCFVEAEWKSPGNRCGLFSCGIPLDKEGWASFTDGSALLFFPPSRGAANRSAGRLVAEFGTSPFAEILRMKKVCVTVVLGLVAVALSVQTASALPPFQVQWKAKYIEGNTNTNFVAAADTAKCNVCHMGTSKKDHNEYGKAVKKYLAKTKYNEIKEDAEAAKKYIVEGLTKAEAEKNAA